MRFGETSVGLVVQRAASPCSSSAHCVQHSLAGAFGLEIGSLGVPINESDLSRGAFVPSDPDSAHDNLQPANRWPRQRHPLPRKLQFAPVPAVGAWKCTPVRMQKRPMGLANRTQRSRRRSVPPASRFAQLYRIRIERVLQYRRPARFPAGMTRTMIF